MKPGFKPKFEEGMEAPLIGDYIARLGHVTDRLEPPIRRMADERRR